MSNLDDYDLPPEHFETEEHEERQQKRGLGKSVAAAWQASPVFKIFLLLVGGGAIASAALGVFSADKPKDEKSIVGQASNVTATPGGEAPPAFQEAVNEASSQRVKNAMQQGGSALPTPMGNTTQMTQLDPAGQAANDPLAEFRAQRATNNDTKLPDAPVAANAPAQQQTTTQLQVTAPVEPPMDPGLAQAMQQQMSQLVGGWNPAASKIITAAASKDVATNNGGAGSNNGLNNGSGNSAADAIDRGKALVSAGTINYGQMAIEANSDVPGPVMAQILSGPFSGGRAVGAFQSTGDYLVIKFTLINFKGRDYPVNALALNPDTTLGGMATETDQRYFSRIILPAAAQFVSGFAQAFSEADQNVYIQDGVVVSQRTGASLRRGLGQGFQGAGSEFSSIINEEANKIKPLVRVASGTPIGVFFVSSVFEKDPEIAAANAAKAQQNQQNNLLNGYGNMNINGLAGYTGQNYGQYGAAVPQTGTQTYNNPYGTLNNGSTSTNYGGYSGSGITVVPTSGSGGPTIINTR